MPGTNFMLLGQFSEMCTLESSFSPTILKHAWNVCYCKMDDNFEIGTKARSRAHSIGNIECAIEATFSV